MCRWRGRRAELGRRFMARRTSPSDDCRHCPVFRARRWPCVQPRKQSSLHSRERTNKTANDQAEELAERVRAPHKEATSPFREERRQSMVDAKLTLRITLHQNSSSESNYRQSFILRFSRLSIA